MKKRLDQIVVDRGLADSRQQAQALIRAGQVLVDDRPADKPGHRFDEAAQLRLRGETCPYVSRGGLKLAGALERFGLLDLSGRLCLDVGASTGGFTDCLLQHGAAHVWAVDTGRGQFHMNLRRDPRVTLREQANARLLTPDWVDDRPMDLVAVDVSFISLRLIFPPLAAILAPGGSVLALVKPQFEAGREAVGKGGVVRDRDTHRRVLEQTIALSRADGWLPRGLCLSHPPGPAGNREFFLWIKRTVDPIGHIPLDDQNAIERVLNEVYNLD